MSVTVFLPCRKGSERIPNKNTKPFAGYAHGLIELKLQQLVDCRLVDKVVVSTDDPDVVTVANEYAVTVHERNPELCRSDTSTDVLVAHALDLIPKGHILWTHVTSPFVTAEIYDSMIERYETPLTVGHDSLMSVTPRWGFLWIDGKPINYDRGIEKWPRTQTLDPVYEVNSAAFIASAEIYRRNGDRIGRSPDLFCLGPEVGIDIDYPEDFALAECALKAGLVSV